MENIETTSESQTKTRFSTLIEALIQGFKMRDTFLKETPPQCLEENRACNCNRAIGSTKIKIPLMHTLAFLLRLAATVTKIVVFPHLT